MFFRRVLAGWLAEGAGLYFDIGVFIGAVWGIACGDIGDAGEEIVERFFQRAFFFLALLNLILQPGDFGHEGSGLRFVLLGFGLPDQLGGFVAAGLCFLQAGEECAKTVIAIQNIARQRLRVGDVAALQTVGEGFRVFADGADIVHGRLILRLGG